MCTDNAECAQALSLHGISMMGQSTQQTGRVLLYFNQSILEHTILLLLTVCFIIGALGLFPTDAARFRFGCLSIDAGTGFWSDSIIGSFSLKFKSKTHSYHRMERI